MASPAQPTHHPGISLEQRIEPMAGCMAGHGFTTSATTGDV